MAESCPRRSPPIGSRQRGIRTPASTPPDPPKPSSRGSRPWIKDLLGLPPQASFAFTSGCQMAHTTCLAAARNHLLRAAGWDVEDRGLAGATRIRILTSAERHGSVERAVRLLGLGKSAIVSLPVDGDGRLPSATLQAELAAASGPAIVLLQAGDLNIAAFDDFETLIPIARAHNAWVHIDGAFGLWAAASPNYRHLTAGVGQADSWATDAHKWLNVPQDRGLAFVAHPESHHAAMSHRESYLIHAADHARDQIDWNPEWSRRGRGFASYAALRELGRAGVAGLVERCCRHTHAIATGIGALDGAELLW